MIVIEPSWIAFAEGLATLARATLHAQASRPRAVDFKSDKSFVTDMDMAIEVAMRAEIRKAFPDHGILGEEIASENPDAEWCWILDPIDGTAAFVAGMPVYGTLIALAHRGAPCLGVIDFPVTGERWVGAKGQATTLNGVACQVRKGVPFDRAMLSASNPDFFGPEEMPVLQALSGVTAWRIYGGAAMSYGRLASGRIDLSVDASLKIHDYAAFVPILEGAGGIITDWEGEPLHIGSGPHVLAAGDAANHAAALAMIRKAWPGKRQNGAGA